MHSDPHRIVGVHLIGDTWILPRGICIPGSSTYLCAGGPGYSVPMDMAERWRVDIYVCEMRILETKTGRPPPPDDDPEMRFQSLRGGYDKPEELCGPWEWSTSSSTWGRPVRFKDSQTILFTWPEDRTERCEKARKRKLDELQKKLEELNSRRGS